MRTFTVTDLPKAEIVADRYEIRFDLNVSDGPPFTFVASHGAAKQIVARLAKVARELDSIMRAAKATATFLPELVEDARVNKTKESNMVHVRLAVANQVEYVFALSGHNAAILGEMLRRESGVAVPPWDAPHSDATKL